MEQEVWKDIEGFEGMYQISNLGRVKSLARHYNREDRVIKGNPNKQYYLQVQLYKDRKRHVYLVHRLVMQAFEPIDNPSEMAVNHKDFNVQNNTLSNLEWCTTAENNQHYWDNAVLSERLATPRGETHHLAVLTEEKVKEIRRLYEENIVTNKSELGRMFGCRENTIRQILKRTTWKNI
ncbi:NUMOD4 motif protein [compost metagenome]